MKKEKIIISGVLVALMLFIQVCGLSARVSYENDRKQLYLSANASDARASGLFFPSVLDSYKNAGIKFVTVSPKTVADYEALGKLSAITYSSLTINEDPVSQSILSLLSPYNPGEKSTVVISTEGSMTDYLRRNLQHKYMQDFYIELSADETTTVFCFPKSEDKNIMIGYDEEELYLIKAAGLIPCLEYPAYTYENPLYPDFFKAIVSKYDPEFLILRKNPEENRVKLSEEMKNVLENSDMTLVVFENENQISNEKPYIYEDVKNAFFHKILRGFNMDKVVSYDETKYMYRYYQWYNSALERNTTFLNVNILRNPDIIIDDNLAFTAKAVETFMEKMQKLGYTFPDKAEEVPYMYRLQTASMSGAVILLVLVYLYLLLLLQKKLEDKEVYFLLLCAVLIIFSFVFYDSVTKYYALLIMITATSLITLALFKVQASKLPKNKKLIYSALIPLGLMITSAVSITALISDFDFFLGDKWFFGVKISLLTPVLLTVLNYYSVYIKTKENLKEFFGKIKNDLKNIPVYIMVIAGVLFALVLAYYLIRTGKSDLILPIEDKIRKGLTDIMIIRPRFKEFLIGYPAFSLFIYFGFIRKNQPLCAIFGIIQIILFTSVVNTFCHTFTLVWVNCMRTLTGFTVGIVISGIIIGFMEIIFLVRKKKPYKFFQKFFKKA